MKFKFKNNKEGYREASHTDWAEDVLKIEVNDGRVYVYVNDSTCVSLGSDEFAKIARKVNKETGVLEA